MIGIGVGIDYALFIVTRYRAALRRGLDPHAATVEAMGTAGRAVVFAGGTVMISLLGMLLMGTRFLQGLALGTSTAVLVAVARRRHAAAGPARLRRPPHRPPQRAPPASRRSDPGDAGTAGAGVVQRRPVVAAVGGCRRAARPGRARRVACAWPSPTPGNDPAGSTTRQAYDLLAEGFGAGVNGPLILVAGDARRRRRGGGARRRSRPSPRLRACVLVTPPVPQPVRRHRRRPGLPRRLARRPSAPRSSCAPLRDDVMPAAADGSGLAAHVGGQTASRHRLRRADVGPAAVVHRRRAAAQLPAAAGRVPLRARAAQGRGDEPAVDRRRLRRDGGGVPVGLARLGDRRRRRRADRAVGADDAVRHRVRPVDGLRGVPARRRSRRSYDAHRRQQPRRGRGPGVDRTGDHRGRRHHGVRVRQLRVRRHARHQADRPRPGRRRADRRHDRAHGAGAGDDGAARRAQLVDAPLARPAAAPAAGRAPPAMPGAVPLPLPAPADRVGNEPVGAAR